MKKLEAELRLVEYRDVLAFREGPNSKPNAGIGEPHGPALGFFQIELEVRLSSVGRHEVQIGYEAFLGKAVTMDDCDQIVRSLSAPRFRRDGESLILTLEEAKR
jgi:hypothetical protein